MSIYTKQTVVKSFPAYDIVEREIARDGYIEITAQDILGLDSGEGFFYTYNPGSVVSYALQYNEDPIEAVTKAQRAGHTLHWINHRATCLTSSKQPKKLVVEVKIGQKVRFEGLIATIERAPNNNLRFAPCV